jgi:hypothetical protein
MCVRGAGAMIAAMIAPVTSASRAHRSRRHHGEESSWPSAGLGLVALLCLLALTGFSRLLDIRLDFLSQLAPLWVYIAYDLSGLRDARSTRTAMLAAVAVTAAVLLALAL